MVTIIKTIFKNEYLLFLLKKKILILKLILQKFKFILKVHFNYFQNVQN